MKTIHFRIGEHHDWYPQRRIPFLPEKDILVAGDFNYSGTKTVMKKFAATGGLLQVDANPKTTFKSNNTDYANPYDHIYISESHTSEYVAGSAVAIDTTQTIYGDNSQLNMATSKIELSDHLPVIAVFDVSGQDDDWAYHMVADLDIYRSAKLLIDQHGEDAPVFAAMQADKCLEPRQSLGFNDRKCFAAIEGRFWSDFRNVAKSNRSGCESRRNGPDWKSWNGI